MQRTSTETIEHFLDRYGWTYHGTSDRVWITGWQSDERSYPLTVSLSDTWILFQVKPLIKVSLDWDYLPELTRHILELNNDCHMVKFSIDEFGEIILSLQLFSSSLTYEDFSDALGIIGHYTDLAYESISKFFASAGFHMYLPQEYLA